MLILQLYTYRRFVSLVLICSVLPKCPPPEGPLRGGETESLVKIMERETSLATTMMSFRGTYLLRERGFAYLEGSGRGE